MRNTVFIDPATKQIMAVYRSCKPAATAWSDQGFKEYPVADGVPVTRNHVATIGKMKVGRKFIDVVTKTTAGVNPIQPVIHGPEPTEIEVIVEAAREAGIALDLDGARTRLKKSKGK